MNSWLTMFGADRHKPFAEWCVYQIEPDKFSCGHDKTTVPTPHHPALLKTKGKTTRELQEVFGVSKSAVNQAAARGREILERFK